HLETPGQLDTLMTVTTPRGWLALAAIGFLLAAAIIWGTLGSLSVHVAGQGIILRPGGIVQVAAMTGGQVSEVRVAPDDLVQPGEALISVDRPEQAEDRPASQGQPGEEAQWSRVVSPRPGRVLDVLVKKGDLLQAGEPVLILEPDAGGEDLEAVIYVPAEEGEKISQGMDALIQRRPDLRAGQRPGSPERQLRAVNAGGRTVCRYGQAATGLRSESRVRFNRFAER
ncbi:MAG: HlyD family efflux transporter periplasmic adaptor subunit, partial [Peptococcaceae bacterium]|nr:HlyD family efflux transporter periplasmic adaptor subunit [Peptococcaceae bacterium]